MKHEDFPGGHPS